MNAASFQRRTDADGWRYSVDCRTRKAQGWWVVERWAGPDLGWQYVATVGSYAAARMVAGDAARYAAFLKQGEVKG